MEPDAEAECILPAQSAIAANKSVTGKYRAIMYVNDSQKLTL